MPYVTSVERIAQKRGMERGLEQGMQQGIQQGIQQGMQQGMQQGIEDLMEVKFGDNGIRLVPLIGKITDIDRLREISRIIKYSQSVGEVERALEVGGNG